jgi:hypothetical protein
LLPAPFTVKNDAMRKTAVKQEMRRGEDRDDVRTEWFVPAVTSFADYHRNTGATIVRCHLLAENALHRALLDDHSFSPNSADDAADLTPGEGEPDGYGHLLPPSALSGQP